jgi:tetratricopeptide (TPR) repeat protein
LKIGHSPADKFWVLIRAADCIRTGDLAQAESLLREVLRKKPQNPDALHLLGLVAHLLGKYQPAASLIEKAIEGRPSDSRMHSNCGEAYRRLGDLDRACLFIRRALELDPQNADAWCNHGSVCRELGLLDEAVSAYRHAISIQSDHSNAHYNLGLALLVTGNFSEGWQEYEYRWKAVSHLKPREYTQPLWKGQDLGQKIILVYHEQGHGDTLQFVRYLPQLTNLGAKVILECPPSFHRLFQCVPGIECRSFGSDINDFDYHIPLLSLPATFNTTMETIPHAVSYLWAQADDLSLWQERTSQDNSTCRIGICWAGNPHHINDRNRSCRLSLFAPLAGIKGATFYSLQKDEAASQAKHPPAGMKIIDFTDRLKDWADTAALIQTLDLIVTVDTAIAHLAGALGRPVWMLVPFDPDWRWLLARCDSPWYPTMRLFRQPERRKWAAVSAALAAAVSEVQGKLDQRVGFSPPDFR